MLDQGIWIKEGNLLLCFTVEQLSASIHTCLYKCLTKFYWNLLRSVWDFRLTNRPTDKQTGRQALKKKKKKHSLAEVTKKRKRGWNRGREKKRERGRVFQQWLLYFLPFCCHVCLLSPWCEHLCMAAAITSIHVTPPHNHTNTLHKHTLAPTYS